MSVQTKKFHNIFNGKTGIIQDKENDFSTYNKIYNSTYFIINNRVNTK